MRDIRSEIIQMIQEECVVTVPKDKYFNLYSDLEFDSLSFAALLIKIEQRYDIIFEISDIENCAEVDKLITTVEVKLGGE